MIRRYRYTCTPICDGCGTELKPEYNFDLAVGAMKAEGWAVVRPNTISSEWYHFCPACKERGKDIG